MLYGTRYLVIVSIILGCALGSRQLWAAESVPLSGMFGVCISPAAGLHVNAMQGIDAIEGTVSGRSAVVEFMLGTSPNLPAAMKVTKTRNGYVLPPLSEDLTLIAESSGALGPGSNGKPTGYGVERLYAFNAERMTPEGPYRYVAFLQIWSSKAARNVALLKEVGDHLHRCMVTR
jgi:hypothetical protein